MMFIKQMELTMAQPGFLVGELFSKPSQKGRRLRAGRYSNRLKQEANRHQFRQNANHSY
jgi:hypothetical protein